MKKIMIDGQEYIEKSECEKMKSIPQGIDENPFMEVGKNYFLRTVTHYFTGTLVWVGEKELVFENACWIADTGRFNEFISEKITANESEPYNKESKVIIGRGAIVDMVERALVLSVK